jgi:NAD+ kinase
MTIGIITNASKDEASAYAHEVVAFLQQRGVTVVPEPCEAADYWVVLGGDGTMLRASHRAAIHRIPMLGINFGNMGFLTDVDRHDGLKAIEDVLNGDYKREERLMLEVFADGDTNECPLTQMDRLALNDIYLSRGSMNKLIKLDLYINGQYMDRLHADGVLISTPTGSTAYNLSAGGPILMPDGDMMVVTAVCPHSLHTRPWVIAARDEVTVVARNPASVALDGISRMDLQGNQRITIRRSHHTAVIIKTSDLHFYELLRRKMYH